MNDEPTRKITRDGETGANDAGLPPDSPRQIGNYRLLKIIGQGGMGEVYAAEQTHPIQRKVALKIIKLGMDSREFTRRFESERQAMAMMDHPCIATVHDAGTSERGRPYIVMEYVPGVPVRQFCNEHKLDIKERLKLFIQICEGVQHAHQKAIIHRDIKSSNVLVSEADGEFRPKIIDFGLAKAVGEDLTGKTIQTQMGEILGTLEYMSPEQVDFTGDKVDTRTDIYLLGVLLYSLLTDLLPFDPVEMRKVGLDGVLYMIRSVDPPRPSNRVRDVGNEAEGLASLRGLSASKLISTLEGDLDWIIMMALEKEKSLRYQTANALAVDIRRYLNNRPTFASPPSATYRIKKFVRRNRSGVVAAALLATAVLMGIVGTTIGMVRAQNAQKVAKTEAETARQVSDFMVGLFDVSDPSEARGNTITAREILDRGVQKIEGGLADQPATQAKLLNTMGRVYKELGLYTAARPLLEKSLSTMQLIDNGPGQEEAVVLDDLGGLLRVSGDFEGARIHLERALAIREQELGPDHAEVAHSLNSYANLLWQIGETDLAQEHYLRALDIRETTLGPNHPEVAITLNNLGGLAMQAGDFKEAQRYFQRALVIRQEALGDDHPDVARSMVNLGKLHWAKGDYEIARSYHENALAIREKVFGPDHPLVADSLNDFAILLQDSGNREEALEKFERALEIRKLSLGPDHPDVAGAMGNIGVILVEEGDYEGARELLEGALAIREAARGPDHIEVAADLNNLAMLRQTVGDYAGALALLERSLAIREVNFGPDHPEVAQSAANIGDALLNSGDMEGARPYFERSLRILETNFGGEHPDVAYALERLGNLHRSTWNLDEAKPLLERSLAIRQKVLGPSHLYTGRSQDYLGLLLYYRGDLQEAKLRFEEALKVMGAHLEPGHAALVQIHYNLACLSALAEDREQALSHLQQALDGGFDNPYITEDGDLAFLHGDPEYEGIVREIQKRAGQ
jgi:non-specific serine/threonine protein kinase/serine/threonine-protein kinase